MSRTLKFSRVSPETTHCCIPPPTPSPSIELPCIRKPRRTDGVGTTLRSIVSHLAEQDVDSGSRRQKDGAGLALVAVPHDVEQARARKGRAVIDVDGR